MTTEDSKSNNNNKNKTLAWSWKGLNGTPPFQRPLSREFFPHQKHPCLPLNRAVLVDSGNSGRMCHAEVQLLLSLCGGWNVLPASALWQRLGLACVGGHSASWDGCLLWKNAASSGRVAGAHRLISPCFPGETKISHLVYPWDLQSNQGLFMTNFWPEEFFMEHFIFAWYMVQVDSCICANQGN